MASSSKGVHFGEKTITATSNVGDNDESDNDKSDEYFEIFMSEAESYATSDEENAKLLQIALEGAYPVKR